MHSRGFLALLLSTVFASNLSESKERPPGRGILQVLNRPKDQRSRPRTGAQALHLPDFSTTDSDRWTNPPQAPLLSFPGSPAKAPLLDFPEPVEPSEPPILDFPDPTIDRDQCPVNPSQADQTKLPAVPSRRRKLGRSVELQNRQLLQYFVRKAIEPNTSVPAHSPRYGLQLLDTTVEIFKSICPKQYLPVYLIDTALDLFKQLHFVTSRGGTEYLKTDDFEFILQILNACRRRGALSIKYFGDACSEQILSYSSPSKKICLPEREAFDPRNFDPLIDIIWHMYNAVQSRCFSNFHVNYRMFHKYGISMLDLLSTPIKRRWKHGSPEQEFPFPDRILGPHYDLYLRNIARCTQVAILTSPLQARRPRYFLPGTTRLN